MHTYYMSTETHMDRLVLMANNILRGDTLSIMLAKVTAKNVRLGLKNGK